ncbi:hypothetical protein [Nonomuraea sp. NPDC049725]|uniref:hypothetical protein n=1 Tax=Nonomuraea sp. NPDC049725 TaxID=3154508 RepID=UPI003438AA62
MPTVVIRMTKPSGETVALMEILRALPDNAWTWTILELWAVGIPPEGMTMPSFEDLISSSESGYSMTWPELLDLAARLDQVMDCLIVATERPHPAPRRLADQDDAPELLVRIDALDSTEWHITTNARLRTLAHPCVHACCMLKCLHGDHTDQGCP